MEAVVLIRHLPFLPRHIQAAVAVEVGVDLVVHVGEGEEVTALAALVVVARGPAHHLFLAHGHDLKAGTKSERLGRILFRIGQLLENLSATKVLPLAHVHVQTAGKSKSRGRSLVVRRSLVRVDRLQQSESVEEVPGTHLPPCRSHQMVKELARKMLIMIRIPGGDSPRLVVIHQEEVDCTPAAEAAAGVVEGGVHHHSHQAAEVKRRGGRKQNERDHGLRLTQVVVGVRVGVEVVAVAVNQGNENKPVSYFHTTKYSIK